MMGLRQVCELTPGGRGAICVLQLRAPNVAEIVDECFRAVGKRPLSECPLRQPVYGFWQGRLSSEGTAADSPDLATREDVVTCRLSGSELEVHCHGGEFAKRRIIGSLVRLGFEVVVWRDWQESKQQSAIAKSASHLLPLTQTIKTASIVNWQIAGALENALAELLVALRDDRIDEALKSIDGLLAWDFLVPHLTQPWLVAIVGPPNVGKSSLMNRLVGFERSIVFDQPGTTRDLVSALTAINGWPVELIDTAGLRETGHHIETMGIDLARQTLLRADLIINVRDATCPESTLSKVDAAAIGSKPVLDVLNKVDLLTDSASENCSDSIHVSAVTGFGIDRLIDEMAHRIVPVEPEFQQAIPFLAAQVAALRHARAAIEAGEAGELRSAIASIEGLLMHE